MAKILTLKDKDTIQGCNYTSVRSLRERKRSELLTTVTDEKAIAAAAIIGAWSLSNGHSGESIAMGIKSK